MPVTPDDIIQSKTGSFDSTSGNATLDTGTTAGSLIVICVAVGGTGFTGGVDSTYTVVTPSGFTVATFTAGPRRSTPQIFAKANSSGGETSWTLTVNAGLSQMVVWAVYEIPGIGLDPNTEFAFKSVFPSSDSTKRSSASITSGDPTDAYDNLVFSVFAGAQDSATEPTWSGHSEGYTELNEVALNNGSRSISMSVAAKPHFDVGTVAASASVSPDSWVIAMQVIFAVDGAKRAPNISAISGFEFGTATNMTLSSIAGGAVAPFDSVTGSPSVVTTSPRTGSYCLELSSSSAAECVTWDRTHATQSPNLGNFPSTGFPWVERFHVYFPTSLPSADVEIASVEAGSLSNGVTIWFRNASSKIGVQVGSGSEVLSDATVSADKWIGIDYRYDARNTTHTCDWQVDYDSLDASAGSVAQTQATGSGMTVANISIVRKGWTTSKTATVRYDDLVGSKVWGTYPLGDMRVRVLKVDPAGTPTVSGTTSNFETFTNNGTGSAWNATNARNALDEIPPVVGGSADGVMQVNVASTDYVEVPLETWTAAPDNVLRALRWYTAGWAASGNPAIMEIRATDGDEITLAGGGDHGFDSSALIWVTRMQRTGNAFYQLTQAKVDAAAIRFGRSTDANPDVGLVACFAELAYSPAVSSVISQVTDPDGGVHRIYERKDSSHSNAVASYNVTTPAGSRGATYEFIIDGSPVSGHVNANTEFVQVVGATSISQVTGVTLTPD